MNLIEGTRDPIGDGGCRIAPTAIDCAPMPDITTGRRGQVEVTAPPRSRATSGFHIGGLHPLRFAERLGELGNLLAHIGGPAWACSSTAAALHGFDGFTLQTPFHIAVPRGRNVSRVGHHIHTVTDLALIDRCHVLDLPATSPTRTIVDLARDHDGEQLTRAIDSATRDGGTTDDFLHRRIVALRGKGRAGAPRLLESLRGIEVTRGGHSWLERRFLELMATAGLPPPQTQQVVGRRRQSLIRVDAAFAGTPIVVEVLGYAFHRTVAQMSADAERLTRLVLDGKEPLQFTYVQVTDEPEFVVASVLEGLARHLPDVRVTAWNDCRSMW